MLPKVNGMRTGWRNEVRTADLHSWYLEGLLDRTEVLRLLVSILDHRSEQELVQGDTDILLVARRRTEIIHGNHNGVQTSHLCSGISSIGVGYRVESPA